MWVTCIVVGTSPSCVFRKVTWRRHVSEIYGVFVNDVTKFASVLMIYVCKKCSESHMVGFLGGILCNSAERCIFVCIVVQDCR